MKYNEAYPSNWLKAEDLNGNTAVVTIESCEIETVDKSTGKKQIVLAFEGKQKRLGLNVTNAKKIAEITGEDDTDAWVGHRICLYPTEVDFKGSQVEAIRIRAPKANGAAPVKSKAKPVREDDEGDDGAGGSDVPF
jgi:hypothetical protein